MEFPEKRNKSEDDILNKSEDDILKVFREHNGQLSDDELLQIFGNGLFRHPLDRLRAKNLIRLSRDSSFFELAEAANDQDKIAAALPWLDKMFPLFPDYNHFNLSTAYAKVVPRDQQRNILASDINTLLIHKFRYAEVSRVGNLLLELTDLGRKVKAMGGHQKYLESIQASQAAAETISKMEFEKLELEVNTLRQTMFDYESTKQRSKNSHTIAIVSLVISGLTLMSQWLCNKNS